MHQASHRVSVLVFMLLADAAKSDGNNNPDHPELSLQSHIWKLAGGGFPSLPSSHLPLPCSSHPCQLLLTAVPTLP